jgi:hypothetical protein
MPRKKKMRGRPPRPMPETKVAEITPETLADLILSAKPRKAWRYLEKAQEPAPSKQSG